MVRVAKKTNKTLGYTIGKEYKTHISQQCNSILFIENDLGDNVVVNKVDFIGKNKIDVVVVNRYKDSNNEIVTMIKKHFKRMEEANKYAEEMNKECDYPSYFVEIYEI